MSCGQSAWVDELAERASTEHEARLKAIPISILADTVDKLTDQFRYLKESVHSLPRTGWYRIDEIDKLLRTLM